ncbi:hypothetical protein E8E11_000707 [Didymella keratinophila]|nr:hypothetical protein E8E11_000707 [Didymella keratinophila]
MASQVLSIRPALGHSAVCLPDPRLDHIDTLTVASRLCEAPAKQNLLALHKQVHKSALRDAAHEALLEELQALYWDVALGAHLSALQSRSEVERGPQESCVHS